MSPLFWLLAVIDPVTYQMAWSPIWFAWDLTNNALLAWAIHKWIKGGVTETSGQVMTEILKPEKAEQVRKAWGIPTLAEIKAILPTVPPMPHVPTVDEIRAVIPVPTVPEMPRVPSAEEIATALQSKQTGLSGVTAKQDKALQASLQAEYAKSPAGQRDAMALAHMLHKASGGMISPGQATFAASLGPVLAREFLAGIIGPKRAETVMTSIEQMAVAQGQRPGGYQ